MTSGRGVGPSTWLSWRTTPWRRRILSFASTSAVLVVGVVRFSSICGGDKLRADGDASGLTFANSQGTVSYSTCARGRCRPRYRTALQAETGLYDVLGVDKDATVSQIKKAYYREARLSHPDANNNEEASRARFQEVAEAYATLADPQRRQQYDLAGLAGLAYLKVNSSRLFGPPPWRVLIGMTDHWLWTDERRDYMIGLMATAIPDGIAGVTVQKIAEAYNETRAFRVATLLERVSENQAKDTVEALEDYGIAVKAEPIEGERSNEQETPLMYFRRIQRELGEAAESLRKAAIEHIDDKEEDDKAGESFQHWFEMVKSLRSELRAAAKGLEEFKLTQTGAAK